MDVVRKPMNAFDIVEHHYRVRLLCHAIQHLLDHTPTSVTGGDVEAVDILQSAINTANPGAYGVLEHFLRGEQLTSLIAPAEREELELV